MSGLRRENAEYTRRLREAYGDELVLSADGGEEEAVHRIVMEFDVAGRSYAVLRPDQAADGEDPLVFLVTKQGEGEYELETIDDDDEWEDVSELVDELLLETDGRA